MKTVISVQTVSAGNISETLRNLDKFDILEDDNSESVSPYAEIRI